MGRSEAREARGLRLRDEAIDRVEDHTDPVWFVRALQSVREVATAFLSHTRDGIVGGEYDPRQPGLFPEKDSENVADFADAADAVEGGE